jgi:hypothetical protein
MRKAGFEILDLPQPQKYHPNIFPQLTNLITTVAK